MISINSKNSVLVEGFLVALADTHTTEVTVMASSLHILTVKIRLEGKTLTWHCSHRDIVLLS